MCFGVMTAFPSKQSARPSEKTTITAAAFMSLAVFLCVCLKLDRSESVPSTKFTSVLTELSGSPISEWWRQTLYFLAELLQQG